MPAIVKKAAWRLTEATFVGSATWLATFIVGAAFIGLSFDLTVLASVAVGVAVFVAKMAGE